MSNPRRDPKSNAGKPPIISERLDLLVIGGGPAGLAAAIEAATLGRRVTLIDENPLPFAAMGENVPQIFGQGMTGIVQNRNAMLDAFIASEPGIERAFEAGVDLRFGTACWGLYGNSAGLAVLPGLVAGLHDEAGARLVQAEAAIVASGRRDMGLAFAGWQLPGVMGVQAARMLLERYADALAPRDLVILGSGTEALLAALAFIGRGIRVRAVIEQAAAPVGPPDLAAAVMAAAIPIHCRHVIAEAIGREAVEAVRLAPCDGDGRRQAGGQMMACSGVVLAVGSVPMIDLLQAAGAATTHDATRGGHVPRLGAAGSTSLPGVHAVGDCAGIWEAKTRDCTIAEAEGRAAAQALSGAPVEAPLPPPPPSIDLSAYRQDWVRASIIEAECDVTICQCEEVSARDLLEVRPARYVGWNGQPNPARTLASLIAEGPPDPDQVKRLTRAGMGSCQGRRCREQIAGLAALQAGVPLGAIALAGYRAPVRPLPLAAAGMVPEISAQTEHWDSWFGMHAQWRPFWLVEEHFTLATNDTGGEVASE